ncbi:MAG: hypothetical protein U1E40_14660 [Amaricoccus sp.]
MCRYRMVVTAGDEERVIVDSPLRRNLGLRNAPIAVPADNIGIGGMAGAERAASYGAMHWRLTASKHLENEGSLETSVM